MTLILDTAPLVALADRQDAMQPRVERILAGEPGDLVVPAPVTAEVDYILGRRLGRRARLAFLADLVAQRFVVASLDVDEHRAVLDLEHRYPDLDAGLADLSVVVIAGRFHTRRVVTFDERHFRALRPVSGGHFALLPADAASG